MVYFSHKDLFRRDSEHLALFLNNAVISEKIVIFHVFLVRNSINPAQS